MAVKAATQSLIEIVERHDEVTSVAKELKQLRLNNHFAENLTRIMSERDG